MTDTLNEVNRIRLMYPAGRYAAKDRSFVMVSVILTSFLLLILLVLSLGFINRNLSPERADKSSSSLEWPVVRLNEEDVDWTVFQARSGKRTTVPGDAGFSDQFRLAGTFFVSKGRDGTTDRQAVLDDLRTGVQCIVRENDRIEQIEVVSIRRDAVVLRKGMVERTVYLSFTSSGGTGKGTSGKSGKSAIGTAGLPSSHGGQQVGDARWIFQRTALLDYYAELKSQPERLVQLFDSFKPVYTSDRKIEGYRIGIEGEKEFIESTGLREGDIVRRVNTLEMTNRRRAELFIRQFVEQDANVFVLDIERDGKEEKLLYQIR